MEKKPNKLKKSLTFLVCILAGIAIGYYAGKMGVSGATGIPKTTKIVLALFFIPAFFIVIGIHEAGHALAAIRVGFDFRTYVVGPFMWNKDPGGWHFSWNKNINTFGGLVLCLPTDTINLNKRFSLYAAGGPIASLLLAGLAYTVFRLISASGMSGRPDLQVPAYFFLIMALLSIVIFIVTAIPMHTGGFSTDGARVLRLARGGDAARFEVLLLQIIAGTTSGLRPGLVSNELLLEAQALATRLQAPFGVYIHSYFHQSAFDRGATEEAEQHLLDYIRDADAIPAGLRNAVWLDAAFFYAFAKKDLAEAERYWHMYQPTALVPRAQVLATEAVISYLKNEPGLAHKKAEASLHEIPNMLDKGLGIALREKMLYLKNEPGNG